jgi:hypothetical protein
MPVITINGIKFYNMYYFCLIRALRTEVHCLTCRERNNTFLTPAFFQNVSVNMAGLERTQFSYRFLWLFLLRQNLSTLSFPDNQKPRVALSPHVIFNTKEIAYKVRISVNNLFPYVVSCAYT